MSAYLAVDDFHSTIEFTGVSSEALAPLVSQWMKDGNVMTIGTADDIRNEGGVHVLINFGNARVAALSDQPVDNQPVISFSGDLSALESMRR